MDPEPVVESMNGKPNAIEKSRPSNLPSMQFATIVTLSQLMHSRSVPRSICISLSPLTYHSFSPFTNQIMTQHE